MDRHLSRWTCQALEFESVFTSSPTRQRGLRAAVMVSLSFGNEPFICTGQMAAVSLSRTRGTLEWLYVVARCKRCLFSSWSVLLYWFWHFNFSPFFLRNTSLMEALILVSTLPGEVLTIIDLNRPSPPQPSGKVRTEDGFYWLSRLWFSTQVCSPFKKQNPVTKGKKAVAGVWIWEEPVTKEKTGKNRLLHYFLLVPLLCHKANTP